jgi:hypothetical protein
MTNKANACVDTLPVAGIGSPEYQSVLTGDTVDLYSLSNPSYSYDPDNYPYDNEDYGITDWCWAICDEDSVVFDWIEHEESTSYTFYPGDYYVYLAVRDDAYNWSSLDNEPYWPGWDWCYVHVNEAPTAVIDGDTERYIPYNQSSLQLIGANSYDNVSVAQWHWSVYKKFGPNFYLPTGTTYSDVNPTITLPAVGEYAILLRVTDNENVDSLQGAVCYVCVYSAEVWQDVYYIPYGTGTYFNYEILPDSDWEPDYVYFYIFDAADYLAYYDYNLLTDYLGEVVVYSGWDGKGNNGWYYNQYLYPGNYYAYIEVYKNGSYAYDYGNWFTVVGQQKIALGGSASLSKYIIGKVYVPTKYGGALGLSGASAELFYTDGSDLTDTKIVQIYNDQLDSYIVASGSPCNYNVPNDKKGWYYVKITNTSATSITAGFEESGQATNTPWNSWFWPRLDSPTSRAVLYDSSGTYTPLKKYDTVYSTTNRATEETNYSGGASWEGHCWGWNLAAIALTQPSATTKSGVTFNQDEMEGLYTELADGATGGWQWKVGSLPSSPIPAGPPTSASGEPVDSWADELQNGLRQYIRDAGVAMIADLRASTVGDPTEVWNHPVYKYVSQMKEASGGNEKIIEVTTVITAGSDVPQMPSDAAYRTDTYFYILEYTSSGEIDSSSANQNWKSATAYAPRVFGILYGTFYWQANHCNITKANVDALYNP